MGKRLAEQRVQKWDDSGCGALPENLDALCQEVHRCGPNDPQASKLVAKSLRQIVSARGRCEYEWHFPSLFQSRRINFQCHSAFSPAWTLFPKGLPLGMSCVTPVAVSGVFTHVHQSVVP